MIEASIKNLAACLRSSSACSVWPCSSILCICAFGAVVGGLTLALMTMLVIVIAGRNAIKSVPPSIRDAALGVGASKMQVAFHHVCRSALPGILTGTIIGVARALGGTAPLDDRQARVHRHAAQAFTEPAIVLPLQYFSGPTRSTAAPPRRRARDHRPADSMPSMNGLAIYLRNRFERRW